MVYESVIGGFPGENSLCMAILILTRLMLTEEVVIIVIWNLAGSDSVSKSLFNLFIKIRGFYGGIMYD